MNHAISKRITGAVGIVFVLVLFAPAPAGAVDYYVSMSGSDGNGGTAGSPWRTIQHAADNAVAGDVVHVADGVYTGFNVTRSGTAGSPITFKADGNAVLLNERNASTTDIINIEGGDYIVIDGFIVEDSPRIGIRAVLATGVVIKNNTVARSGLTGILSGWTPQIEVINNVSWGATGEHGIYLSNSNVPNDNPVVRGNEVYGNAKNGIQLNGDCWEGGDGVISGALIEDNFVHDNNWKGFSLISMQNSVVRNNVIYDNGVSAGAGGIHLTDQVGPACGLPSSNNVVVNNTIVEPRIACIRMTDGSTANVIFNNLVVASSTSKLIEDEVGGNFIDAGSNLTTTSSSGHFVNEAAHDYHLAPSSTAIDAGRSSYQSVNAPNVDRDGNTRPGGSATDVGAYETGSSTGGDTEAPDVGITTPANNSTVDRTTTVMATATDNVAVAGVQFKIDGANLGAEDTQPPFTTDLFPSAYTNGFYTLTAVARDAAGNTGTSAGVTVFIDNRSAPGGILAGHPRLHLVDGRLAELRALACYDNAGNKIPACTGSYYWGTMMDLVDNRPDKADPWQFALAYIITGDVSYANTAMSECDQMVACDYSCIAAANNKFLYVRDFMRNVCLVYDWLYDLLSPSQKNAYINYMNKMIFITWNDNAEANGIFDTGAWATSNPNQNYYYNYLLATVYVALATHDENPGTFVHNGSTHTVYLLMNGLDQSDGIYYDMLDFFYAKLNEEAFPSMDTHGFGGGWPEGENYGRAMKRHIAEAFLMLQQTAGVDYFNDPQHPFLRDAVRYQLHTVQPMGRLLYPGGDASQEPTLTVNPYDRHMMLLLADGLQGTVESEYAQYWLNHVYTEMNGISVMIPVDFFHYRPELPERDFSELSSRYFAEGIGWVNSRSSWANDAVSVTFTCTDRFTGHQHSDQNSFVIYKGGSSNAVNGWLMTDTQPYSSTLPRSSWYHNTYVINNTSQRNSYFEEGEIPEVTGEMVKFEATPGYTYAVGDASDAYWTNPAEYSHGDDKMTEIFQRELVHILPGYVVAFDRITLTPDFATVPVECMFHYPYVQPGVVGNQITSTTDVGRVFQKILLPDTYTLRWVDENVEAGDSRMETFRMELQDQQTKPSYQFLNVFYATTSSVGVMPETEKVTSASGNMVGTLIRDQNQEQVLMFSTDPAGTPPAGNIIYEVGVDLRSRHHLFDLEPVCGYSVELAEKGESKHISVSRGGPWVTTTQGTLVFNLSDVAGAGPVLARGH